MRGYKIPDFVFARMSPYKRITHAHAEVAASKKSGFLVPKKACERCESTYRVEAAHYDYQFPLHVRWLCKHCHATWDRGVPKNSGTRSFDHPRRYYSVHFRLGPEYGQALLDFAVKNDFLTLSELALAVLTDHPETKPIVKRVHRRLNRKKRPARAKKPKVKK